ncbi:hypothetical protein BKA69DRAFT_1087122 [Paraphysoderma sedebokerense]|nr:hypothetical protein BKA69DRAFT_1087122 [Paraphysoderma sedebokerense]
MTRFTKLHRKTHLDSSGFAVNPLIPLKRSAEHSSSSSDLTSQPNLEGPKPNVSSEDSLAKNLNKDVMNGNITGGSISSNLQNDEGARNEQSGQGQDGNQNSADPAKKKTKRRKKKRKDNSVEGSTNSEQKGQDGTSVNPDEDRSELHATKKDLTGTSGSDNQNENSHVNGNKKTKRSKPKDVESRKLASMRRRERRIKKRIFTKICFHCRQPGHPIKECPLLIPQPPNSNSNTPNTSPSSSPTLETHPISSSSKEKPQISLSVCYICGSPSHTTKTCHSKHKLQFDPITKKPIYPFAVCFICKEKGHLSGQCDKNENGVYPMGGCCKHCGSKEHLARDCRPGLQDSGTTALGKISIHQSGDDDDVFLAIRSIDDDRVRRKSSKGHTDVLGNGTIGPGGVGGPKKSSKKVVMF